MAKKKEQPNINSGRMEDFLSPANRHEVNARPLHQAAMEIRLRGQDENDRSIPPKWDQRQYERDFSVTRRVDRLTANGGGTRRRGDAFE